MFRYNKFIKDLGYICKASISIKTPNIRRVWNRDFCGGSDETRRIPPNATRQTRLFLLQPRPAVHFSTGTRLIREARESTLLLSIAILRIARRVDTETNRPKKKFKEEPKKKFKEERNSEMGFFLSKNSEMGSS